VENDSDTWQWARRPARFSRKRSDGCWVGERPTLATKRTVGVRTRTIKWGLSWESGWRLQTRRHSGGSSQSTACDLEPSDVTEGPEQGRWRACGSAGERTKRFQFGLGQRGRDQRDPCEAGGRPCPQPRWAACDSAAPEAIASSKGPSRSAMEPSSSGKLAGGGCLRLSSPPPQEKPPPPEGPKPPKTHQDLAVGSTSSAARLEEAVQIEPPPEQHMAV